MFLSSSTRGLEISWINTLILVHPRFIVLDDLLTSSLFRTRFEVIFLFSFARGLEWFRSSFARGSKIILVKLYFYPPLHEVLVKFILLWSYTWKPAKLGSVPISHLKVNQTWFCSGLTLESQSNLVLFRSYTWMPIKLDSVLVLHLKANQTWFKFCHMPTYLDLPLTASWVVLWLCHTYLLDRTYNSEANLVRIWNSLKTSICLNYLLSSRRSFWSFYRVQDSFSLCIPVSDKKTYMWCNVSCNVWLCMNKMFVYHSFY